MTVIVDVSTPMMSVCVGSLPSYGHGSLLQ
jgi:hypothetical protein